MSDTEDFLEIKRVDCGEEGIKLIRVMSPAEIKARVDLNMANTASSQRAKVLAELSRTNGHSHKRSD